MVDDIRKRLLVLFILLFLIVVGVGLTGQVVASMAANAKTLDRNLEPVSICGADVGSLVGTSIEHLFVYTYTGADWGGQIPIQVDEVTATDSYTTTEDGLLDANDEIVFMAMDLGDQAPDMASLSTTLPISATWFEIEVTDPTDPAKKGWAYLVRSSVLTSSMSTDYVDYMTATQRITTSHYELGLATTHSGLDYLALSGSSVDVLDRTKLRVALDTPLGPVTLTEDDPTEVPPVVLVKDGPVRLILERGVSISSVVGQASLSTTYLAYASLLQATASLSYTPISLVTLSSVRTSVDLDSAAVVSPTTFYNANTSGGVTIDGSPDAVAETPLSYWGQVSHTSGRLIQVADPTPAGGTQKNFYRDDSSPETPDTGQPGSYGDSGILIEGSLNQMFTTESSLFVLPPPDSGPDNVGTTYEEYFFNPLTVVASLKQDRLKVFLPIILKNSD
jgi:hypothetical protein